MIIGIDGGIGKALGDALSVGGHQVTGTTRRPENVNDTTLYLDLNSVESTATRLPKADVAFFCAAETRYKECGARPEMAWRVNTISPAAIAKRLVEQGTRVVLLSTSAVLDCSVPHMTADRPRRPASIYGRTKAAAENAFLALGHTASVLRLTKVLNPGMERFDDWIQTLIKGGSIYCPHDLRFSPIMLYHAVRASIAIADQEEGGIFQVSGASDISYAEAARYIASKLGAPNRLVEACSSAELDIPSETVTAYTSLDTTRLKALYGFAAPDPWTVIAFIVGPMVASARSTAHSAS